jgi:hypothetical protein
MVLSETPSSRTAFPAPDWSYIYFCVCLNRLLSADDFGTSLPNRRTVVPKWTTLNSQLDVARFPIGR